MRLRQNIHRWRGAGCAGKRLIVQSTIAKLEGRKFQGFGFTFPWIYLPMDPCILGSASGEAGSGFASLASACDVEGPLDRVRSAPDPVWEPAVHLTAAREPPEILVSYGLILFLGCAIDAPFRDVRKGLSSERLALLISLLLYSCPLPGWLCFSKQESLLVRWAMLPH